MAELWRRFVVGHGPTSVRDFARWSSLDPDRGARCRRPRRRSARVTPSWGTRRCWWDPGQPAADPISGGGEAVRLVPLYDELTLSYPAAQLPDLAPVIRILRMTDRALGLGDRRADATSACGGGRWSTGDRRRCGWPPPSTRSTSSNRRVAVEHELDRLAVFLQAEPVKEDWTR